VTKPDPYPVGAAMRKVLRSTLGKFKSRPCAFLFATQSTNADALKALLLMFANDFGCGQAVWHAVPKHCDAAGALVCCPICWERVQVLCLLNFSHVVFDFLVLLDSFQDGRVIAQAWLSRPFGWCKLVHSRFHWSLLVPSIACNFLSSDVRDAVVLTLAPCYANVYWWVVELLWRLLIRFCQLPAVTRVTR